MARTRTALTKKREFNQSTIKCDHYDQPKETVKKRRKVEKESN